MALVIALLLLVVITLIGFTAVRSTIVQQKMSANLYDREVAFQNAEAAMRYAAGAVQANPSLIARNCQAGSVPCPMDPFSDSTITAADIHDVPSGSYTPGATAAGPPQFVIQSLGNWVDSSQSTGFNQTANAHNYNAQGQTSTAVYYRITSRSGNPSLADMKNRAVVTLQSVYKIQ